jgi:hypothetical protein
MDSVTIVRNGRLTENRVGSFGSSPSHCIGEVMESIEERRFWKKVDIKGVDDCWEWKGAIRSGYGAIKRNGKVVRAHRVSYELTNGNIDNNLLVIHSCDNPMCVNPNHLRQGTYGDNICDMIRRGRANYCNTNKTHCPQGHEYTPENIYWEKNGTIRRCKICKTNYNKVKTMWKCLEATL